MADINFKLGDTVCFIQPPIGLEWGEDLATVVGFDRGFVKIKWPDGESSEVIARSLRVAADDEKSDGQRLHQLKLGYTQFDLQNWWPAKCITCGWRGLSRDCQGGGEIADTGGHDDVVCPVCYIKEDWKPVDEDDDYFELESPSVVLTDWTVSAEIIERTLGSAFKMPMHQYPATAPFQQRVDPWLMACFGEEIARNKEERNHRFLEEALELVQATGCTSHEAHQLVDYVFSRPIGEPYQEVGGVMVTLAALCLAQGLDMHEHGETELARVWTKVEKIRAKQAAKPKHSPLPIDIESNVLLNINGQSLTPNAALLYVKTLLGLNDPRVVQTEFISKQWLKGVKYGEHDYYEYHVEGVKARLRPSDLQGEFGPLLIMVTNLHDVLEDTLCPHDDIRALGMDVYLPVLAITHNLNESNADYLIRCKMNPIARIVKIADASFNRDQSVNTPARYKYYNDVVKFMRGEIETPPQKPVKIAKELS